MTITCICFGCLSVDSTLMMTVAEQHVNGTTVRDGVPHLRLTCGHTVMSGLGLYALDLAIDPSLLP